MGSRATLATSHIAEVSVVRASCPRVINFTWLNHFRDSMPTLRPAFPPEETRFQALQSLGSQRC